MNSSSKEISREDLMDLSLDAAIEVERAILGQPINENVLRRMTAALEGTFKREGIDQASLVDPRVVSIYSRAVISMGQPQMRTVQAVRDWVGEFSKRAKVSNSTAKGRTGTLEAPLSQLRDFLLALHRELVADVATEVPEPSVSGRTSNELARKTSFAN